jgi:hypothetical protein
MFRPPTPEMIPAFRDLAYSAIWQDGRNRSTTEELGPAPASTEKVWRYIASANAGIPGRWVFASHRVIAARCRMSPRTVSNGLNWLLRAGLLLPHQSEESHYLPVSLGAEQVEELERRTGAREKDEKRRELYRRER